MVPEVAWGLAELAWVVMESLALVSPLNESFLL